VVIRPVGDQPPSVYWVRRGLLVAVVLVVVAILWWLWPAGADTTETAAPDPSPSASPTDTSSASPTPTKTKKKKPKEELEPACSDDAIEVTVSTNAETYAPDRNPSFTFAVENVSKNACSRDVGQLANELRVTSGGAKVWSSDDCNPGGAVDRSNLGPGDRFVQSVNWARVRSAEGCPTPEEAAGPGTYQVLARNGDLLSEPAVFELQ